MKNILRKINIQIKIYRIMLNINIQISLKFIMNEPKEAVLKSPYDILIKLLIYLTLSFKNIPTSQQLIQKVEEVAENRIEMIQTQKSDTVPTIEFTPR
jgi:hypothetical protein